MTTRAVRALGVVALVAGLGVLVLLLQRSEPDPVALERASRRVAEAVEPSGLASKTVAPAEREQAALVAEEEPVEPEPAAASPGASAPDPARSGSVLVALLAPNGQPLMEALGDPMLPEPRVLATREPIDLASGVQGGGPLERCGRFKRKAGRSPADRHLGTIALSCERPVWVSLFERGDVVASELVRPGDREVVFVLDPEAWAARFASLRFCAVNARTGEPVKSVHPYFTFETGESRSVPSGEDGCVHVHGLPPGGLTLDFVAWRFANTRRELVLARGEQRDLGVVRLEPAQAATVRVLLRRPESARAIRLHAMLAAALVDEKSAPPDSLAMPVGEEERVELPLYEGRWAFWATTTVDGEPWRSATHDVAVGAGLTEITLEIVATAPVELQALSSSGMARVFDASGLQVEVTVVGTDRPTTVLLLPGSYELRVPGGEGAEERVVPFTVGPDGATVSLP